jgi:hypothetical protein
MSETESSDGGVSVDEGGVSVKWGSHGKVKAYHPGDDDLIGKEFKFRKGKTVVTVSARHLTRREKRGGGGTSSTGILVLTVGDRIIYEDHERGTRYETVVNGRPPSRRQRSRRSSDSFDDEGVRTGDELVCTVH